MLPELVRQGIGVLGMKPLANGIIKTSSIFDGTAEHPEWLGDEPSRLQNLMP